MTVMKNRGSVWLIGIMCAASIGCSKLLGGDKNGGNPLAPSNVSTASGVWNGTLTRPNGQVVMLRWNASAGKVGSEGFDGLVGPMTLTGPSASTTVAATAGAAGNDKQGYTLRLQFNDATPPATCIVRGNSTAGVGDPYPAPYTTIVGTFSMSAAADCRGVFDGATQFTNLTESVRISLSK